MVGLLASWKNAAKLLEPRELSRIIYSSVDRLKSVALVLATKFYVILGAYILSLCAVFSVALVVNNSTSGYYAWVAFQGVHYIMIGLMSLLIRWNSEDESVGVFLRRSVKPWIYLNLAVIGLIVGIVMVAGVVFMVGYYLVNGPVMFVEHSDALGVKIRAVSDACFKTALAEAFFSVVGAFSLSYLLDLTRKKTSILRSIWQAFVFSLYNLPLVGFFVLILITMMTVGAYSGNFGITLANGKQLFLYADFLKYWIFVVVGSSFVIIYERLK